MPGSSLVNLDYQDLSTRPMTTYRFIPDVKEEATKANGQTGWTLIKKPVPLFFEAEVCAGGPDPLYWAAHAVQMMTEEGRMALICGRMSLAKGSHSRVGKAERAVRQTLCGCQDSDQPNLIEAVISLPAKLFADTTLSSSMILINRVHQSPDQIVFIEAGGLGVSQGRGKQSELSEAAIQQIFEAYQTKREEPNFSAAVSLEAVAEEDYNLTPKLYVLAPLEPPQFDPPEEIIRELMELEKEIQAGLENLQRMIDGE